MYNNFTPVKLKTKLRLNMSGQGVRQDFIFFAEQATDSCFYKSEKMLHTYMNRLAIDEDDQNEILGIQKLKETSLDLRQSTESDNENHEKLRSEREEKFKNDKSIIIQARFSF